jgi:competence protein ComEC
MNLLIAATAGLAGGIFFRSLFLLPWPVMVFVFILACVCLLVNVIHPRPAYARCAVLFFFFALGIARFAIADTSLPSSFAAHLDRPVSYEGIVVADPDVRDATQRVVVRVNDTNEITKVLAVADRYPVVRVGERVQVSGKLALPEPFSTADDGGRIFAYDKYLQKSGVRFLVTPATLAITQSAPQYSLLAALANVKHAFLNGLAATLPEPYASLAGGIVIGGKTGLGKELQQAFITTGLVQVIVLSGYNVMIVAEWVMYLLGLLKLRRGWSAFAGVVAIVLFIAIAGASSTAIRAGVMAAIALYARASARTYAAGRALFFVIFLMLLWNPFILAFDPGFSLSVVATAGLIWLAPLIELKLVRIKNAFARNALATTLAAQVAVLPLLLYQTGILSLVSVPANLLVALVMPLAMGFAALAGIAGILLGTYGWPLALPAYAITAYIISIAREGSALPLAAFHLPAFPFIFVLLAYALLIYRAWSKRFSINPQFTLSRNAST